ncbi:hypothetical protein AWM75_04205 [Aerococcus urinaehominis]|uniref:Uncharacterized protein n=1 Tax=Aerococcus urinaehominis TaxID=128944 RepID=A0A120IAV2_9LACT|nr:hypothetical protein [Aerococcus urinaehominis]AMB99251.1 hypothetical protein AWM75_04205 [Aerococcus urinaehominis]SDM46472.1 hypothetical protein SAMN04487985_1187 [Aerococcus urinaehominis]
MKKKLLLVASLSVLALAACDSQGQAINYDSNEAKQESSSSQASSQTASTKQSDKVSNQSADKDSSAKEQKSSDKSVSQSASKASRVKDQSGQGEAAATREATNDSGAATENSQVSEQTVPDQTENRQIIADTVGIDVSELDRFTDAQILESRRASEELGSDPGYSYQYLLNNF